MKVCLAAARSGLTRLQAPAVRKPARNGSTPVPSCTRHLEPSGTSRMELCVGRDSSTSTLAWASHHHRYWINGGRDTGADPASVELLLQNRLRPHPRW